jgi:uncharacterized protein YdhG (YjbR/CyaY superfamily)
VIAGIHEKGEWHPMKGPARDFDDYIAMVREPARTTLQKMHRTIRAAVREGTETISYRMPTFRYRGKPLVACRRRRTTAHST